jgi:LytS/YehU family sensor histidine kinase
MYIKGDKLARYFVFGSFALFAGDAYLLICIILGYNPGDHLYGYQLGAIAQVFIFSMGLSYRYERMNRENIQSKHLALNSQIDPHFFFNSLSVLSSLVYKDPDKSVEYINQLSKVYRNILDESNENIVPLENELKLLDSYIFLMKIRFGSNISFAIEISDKGRKNAYIPPNTLQLLVENAIKHNKCSSEEPLFISISEDQQCIHIKNNVNRRTLIDESSGIGLENIKHRFELLGGKKIVVNKHEHTFTVTLPKYNKGDYESINI